MDKRIAALEKRVADLEAEVRWLRETEWDRYMLLTNKGIDVKLTDIDPDYAPGTRTAAEIEDMLRLAYYRRLAAFRAAHGKDAGTTS